jgi:hypothetical protein
MTPKVAKNKSSTKSVQKPSGITVLTSVSKRRKCKSSKAEGSIPPIVTLPESSLEEFRPVLAEQLDIPVQVQNDPVTIFLAGLNSNFGTVNTFSVRFSAETIPILNHFLHYPHLLQSNSLSPLTYKVIKIQVYQLKVGMAIPIFSIGNDWSDPNVRVIAIMQVTSIFPVKFQQLCSCSTDIPYVGTITFPIQYIFALNHIGIKNISSLPSTNSKWFDLRVVAASRAS